MESAFRELLYSRIDDHYRDLHKTNGEFASVQNRLKELLDKIHPIIVCEGEIKLTALDCEDLKEYMDKEFTSVAIMQQEFYRQGYLDCVKLLQMLEVLR